MIRTLTIRINACKNRYLYEYKSLQVAGHLSPLPSARENFFCTDIIKTSQNTVLRYF
jgi:hypothetical protein